MVAAGAGLWGLGQQPLGKGRLLEERLGKGRLLKERLGKGRLLEEGATQLSGIFGALSEFVLLVGEGSVRYKSLKGRAGGRKREGRDASSLVWVQGSTTFYSPGQRTGETKGAVNVAR